MGAGPAARSLRRAGFTRSWPSFSSRAVRWLSELDRTPGPDIIEAGDWLRPAKACCRYRRENPHSGTLTAEIRRMLAQDKGMRGIRFVKTALPLMLCALIVQATTCVATEVNGTIQLHSKSEFDVVTSREDTSYDIITGNRNEFTIKAAAYSGSDSVIVIATDNSEKRFPWIIASRDRTMS